ncbi:hypothetical protein DFA_03502 [Cavenderia fasciculata]|uniref:Calcium-activated BK potassium channel n=1 Tax=Cavenderia fasciculata TaxID=261658 RepID=F4PHS0_CACFS|nr:uncharacterized protein DFA_03502 [Cavenderia fasciculata]EGG25254.1 hypothetical protein DFA_03502 [Cavenderia fasciculata]|eukprot:XP_004363105.1 hypothetical protein DFA_03502 [Cavenderia fasciculata]
MIYAKIYKFTPYDNNNNNNNNDRHDGEDGQEHNANEEEEEEETFGSTQQDNDSDNDSTTSADSDYNFSTNKDKKYTKEIKEYHRWKKWRNQRIEKLKEKKNLKQKEKLERQQILTNNNNNNINNNNINRDIKNDILLTNNNNNNDGSTSTIHTSKNTPLVALSTKQQPEIIEPPLPSDQHMEEEEEDHQGHDHHGHFKKSPIKLRARDKLRRIRTPNVPPPKGVNIVDDPFIELDSVDSRYMEDEDQAEKRRILGTRKYETAYIKIDYYLEHINIFFSVVCYGIYIAISYVSNDSHAYSILKTLFLVLFAYFLADFIRGLIFAGAKLRYLATFTTFIDIITILPMAITIAPTSAIDIRPLGFIRIVKLITVPNLLRLHGYDSLVQKVAQLTISIAVLILLTAGIMMEIEEWPFHNSLYFSVVTLATVGYGDFVPTYVVSRMLIVAMIIAALLFLPIQTSELLKAIGSFKSWHGKNRTNQPFSMIVGNINERSLNTFLKEYFFNTRISSKLSMVIFSIHEPPPVFHRLSEVYSQNRFLSYIQGSSSNEHDIERANLKKARSVFIFSKQSYQESKKDDVDNILRIMAIRSFSDVPIYAQVMNPNYKKQMYDAGATQVISIQELKMMMLAQSCLSPGFSTLMMNLLRSDVTKYSEIDEYGSGNGYEIFNVPLSSAFFEMTFKNVTKLVFEKLGMTIFGIISIMENEKNQFRLNPYHYTIKPGDIAIMLSKNRIAAKRVTNVTSEFLFSDKAMDSKGKLVHSDSSKPKIKWTFDKRTKRYKVHIDFDEQNTPTTKSPDSPKKEHKPSIKEKLDNYFGSLDSPHMFFEPTIPHENNIRHFLAKRRHSFSTLPLSKSCVFRPKPLDTPRITRDMVHHKQSKPFYRSDLWQPRSFEDAFVDSVVDDEFVKNHIIIAGDAHTMYWFIKPLREDYLHRIDPIVILTKHFPIKEWSLLSKFPEVYIIEGSGTKREDLVRAGILKCSKLVVTSSERNQDSESILRDRNTLQTVIAAKPFLLSQNNFFPIFELEIPQNSHFIPGNEFWRQSTPIHLCPLFASGSLVFKSVFDSLLSQCFYNPHILSLIETLVGLSSPNTKIRTRLFQVEIPPKFVGCRYGFFLGLFRTNPQNLQTYPVPNPESSLQLRDDDHLFILVRV